MKCDYVRTVLSQIADKSVTMQIQQADLNFLTTNGYVSVLQKEEYDRALAEVSNLAQLNEELQNQEMEERSTEAALEKDVRKTHSIFFHFEGKDEKQTELERVANEANIVSKEEAETAEKESKVNELIVKKSMIDRMVPYGEGQYLSLTGLGTVTLSDLNVRNYRVSDTEFEDFVGEIKATYGELRSIAERASFYVSNFKTSLDLRKFQD
jgi:hypothetical protein